MKGPDDITDNLSRIHPLLLAGTYGVCTRCKQIGLSSVAEMLYNSGVTEAPENILKPSHRDKVLNVQYHCQVVRVKESKDLRRVNYSDEKLK